MAGFNLNDLLNSKSKGAAGQQEVMEEQEDAFCVVMLDVEDLMPSKDNFYSTENIEELATSIELAGGIEQNLVVKPEAHGKYEVIAGHRRRMAALKLVTEGKEEYRKVPCRIKKESDAIKDKLSLILTNSTARQLTDWEKIQQVKELKEVLIQYKEALQEENKDKPKEERIKMGRIREIVAQMLRVSTTQIGRMEAIDNNLSKDFKKELEKGNIGISAAHELSRLDEEAQEKVYEQYEKKGELQIKDVKQEPKVIDEQLELVEETIEETKEVYQKIDEQAEMIETKEESDEILLPGQLNISDYPEYMPNPIEKNLPFTTWIRKKYGMAQYSIIRKVIRNTIDIQGQGDLENRITNAVSLWVMDKTEEYQNYLQG